jgi:hypothetical protein
MQNYRPKDRVTTKKTSLSGLVFAVIEERAGKVGFSQRRGTSAGRMAAEKPQGPEQSKTRRDTRQRVK